jgi:hypothetical protein
MPANERAAFVHQAALSHSELGDALSILAEIKNVGELSAVEILLQTIGAIERICDGAAE